MRDYAKVSPKFWIGPTGKAIRRQGAKSQVLALYLMTNPHANMLGIYHLPAAYIAADTGISLKGALEGLQRLSEAGFCGYDEASEVVFVYEMARYQIGEQLKPKDNQVEGIRREYRNLPENRFLLEFFEKYSAAFHLKEARGLQAPPKPLGSQEQEQEKEQEKEQEQHTTGAQPRAGSRAGILCKQFRAMGIDAAPHMPLWPDLLNRFTDEEIIACAELAKAKKPGKRLHVNYLIPVLNDQSAPKRTSAGRSQRKPSSHSGFDLIDYREGVTADGRF